MDPSTATATTTTVGEARTGVPRSRLWLRVGCSQFAAVFFTLAMALGFWHTIPAFYSSAPWRVPMWLSWGVYMSLASWVDFYVELFLPLTPLALEKAFFYGGVLFGSVALGVMELAVLATCADARVLAGCTCVVAACITGVVVFWARIGCVYRD